MKAAGYFRPPSGPGAAESLARQQRAFLDYCESQGYEVIGTFAEESGAPGGAAFARLIEFLRQPEKGFVLVVVESPGTLAEEPATAAARLLQVEALGGRVQFMDRAGDALAVFLAQWQDSHDDGMGQRVRAAMRHKAMRGEVLGRPPYGYRVGADNRLERVDEESVVVRYIFRLYLHEGIGIRLIARRLNEEGLRTRRNGPWSMVSIRDILRNRAYLGTYQRLGVRVPGTHPALVSPDDFRKVQERLSDRRTNYSPRSTRPFLLSGLVVCGHCGNRLIGVSRKQSWRRRRDGLEQAAVYRYYQCESRTNQGICSYRTRRAEVLEREVRDVLAELDPHELEAGNEAAVLGEWQAETSRLRERLRQVDRRIGRSFEAAASSKLSPGRLRSQGLVLAEERLQLEEDLRVAQWRADHYASTSERRRARADTIARVVQGWDRLPLAEHRELLRRIVDRVEVSDSGVSVRLRP